MGRTKTSDRFRTWLTVLGGVACVAIIAACPAQAQSIPAKRVPLSAVAKTPGGTFTSPSLDFRWAIAASPGVVDGAPAPHQVVLRGSRTQRCRWIHLEFAAGGQAQSAAVSVWRAGRAPVTAEASSDERGSLDVALRPGRAWSVAASTPASSVAAYLNGYVVCRGSTGLSVR